MSNGSGQSRWQSAIASLTAVLSFSGAAVAEAPAALGDRLLHRAATAVAQAPSTDLELGSQLLSDLSHCVRRGLRNPLSSDFEALQTASTQCFLDVVLLDENGSLRRDANARMTALVDVTGVSLPVARGSGSARVSLQPLPDSQVYGLAARVGGSDGGEGRAGTFLLDTGASSSVVANGFVADLDIDRTPVSGQLLNTFSVGSDCDGLDAGLLTFDRLAVADASVSGSMGMTLPDSAIPGDADGVLGLDFLSRFDVVLDPAQQQLDLRSPTDPDPAAIPLTGNLGMMVADVQINGRRYRLGLDTGADIMVLPQRVADELTLDLRDAETVEVLGFCGRESSTMSRLDRVQVGEFAQSDLDAVILADDLFDLIGIDGLVGQNFLNRYRQHWRFGDANALGYPDGGSLELREVRRSGGAVE